MLLPLSISGGWPAASAADSLARYCGEEPTACHSTWVLFCFPQSTKMAPTVLSVTSFQLLVNQTVSLPGANACCPAGVVPDVTAAPAAVGAGGLDDVSCAAAPQPAMKAAAPPNPANPATRRTKARRDTPDDPDDPDDDMRRSFLPPKG